MTKKKYYQIMSIKNERILKNKEKILGAKTKLVENFLTA